MVRRKARQSTLKLHIASLRPGHAVAATEAFRPLVLGACERCVPADADLEKAAPREKSAWAGQIKERLDGVAGGAWHVVGGKEVYTSLRFWVGRGFVVWQGTAARPNAARGGYQMLIFQTSPPVGPRLPLLLDQLPPAEALPRSVAVDAASTMPEPLQLHVIRLCLAPVQAGQASLDQLARQMKDALTEELPGQWHVALAKGEDLAVRASAEQDAFVLFSINAKTGRQQQLRVAAWSHAQERSLRDVVGGLYAPRKLSNASLAVGFLCFFFLQLRTWLRCRGPAFRCCQAESAASEGMLFRSLWHFERDEGLCAAVACGAKEDAIVGRCVGEIQVAGYIMYAACFVAALFRLWAQFDTAVRRGRQKMP